MTPETAEASAIRYNISRIVRLSTGRFAVFSPWTNDDGIDLLAIGTLAEIEPMILTAAECTDWVRSLSTPIDLTALLRIPQPPTQPFPRRL